MDNRDWMELHRSDSGLAMLDLLEDEMARMMRARENAYGNLQGYPASYWIDEDLHHAERVSWLKEQLGAKLLGI